MDAPQQEIRLSVALVTRNRPESLDRCLGSLRKQNVQPFEVVVSDDSDVDGAAATRAVAERWGCRYTTGPKRGLYGNRNHAALTCRGTHIRTMDDDHTFPDGHFAQCLAAVKGDPRAIWTTGEISFIEGMHFDPAETANQLHPSGVGTAVENPDDNWAIADGSTIYPASVFASGLRMVEEFGYGESYLEFGAFLYRNGYRSRCIRGALVEHHASYETVSRGGSAQAIKGRVWASLCYNLYFRPNWILAARYATLAAVRGPARMELAACLPRLLTMAHQRWRNGR